MNPDKADYRIQENSWIAWLAAKKLRSNKVAIVLGSTIYLWNSSAADFINNERWFKHELCHIQQYKQHGYLIFIAKYIWESIWHGYQNNKYEVAARAAETN